VVCSWWTADTVAEPRTGSVAEFGFVNRATLFRMRIKELTPPARIVWECIGDQEEWKGTRLTWEISGRDAGSLLRFQHGNWRSVSGYFATCNTTWGGLLHRLKDYVEGKNPGPRWTS
jgi:uncharacterized protein YndB with AHSA1/START domain